MIFKTADLYDAHEDDESLRVCAPLFRNFGGKPRFYGRIETVKCFEDNTEVKAMLNEPGDGRVLVVDAGGSMRCAMIGDMIAEAAADNDWVGVLMNGCVRDAVELADMPLGIKALAAVPRKSMRRGEGQRSIPVRFADVTFHPNDWLYSDEDGILIAAHALDQ